MKRLLYGSALCTLGLFCFAPQDAQAACSASEPNQIGPHYNYSVRYGVQVRATADTDSTDPNKCNAYATPINNYPTNRLTKKASDSYNASSSKEVTYHEGLPAEYDFKLEAAANTSASISSGTVQAAVFEYGDTWGTSAGASAEFRDLIMIQKPSATPAELNYIPVTFCSDLKSEFTTIGGNRSRLAYGDFHWQGSAAGDQLIWDSGSTGNVTHTANDSICNTGDIIMQGTAVYFVITMDTYTIGNQGIDVVKDGNDNDVNVIVRDGSIKATFDMGAIPSGATCYSASGNFPGCERPLPDAALAEAEAQKNNTSEEKEEQEKKLTSNGKETDKKPQEPKKCPRTDQVSTSAGNPVNFALGYKYQTEVDYAGGALSFARYYRSDSTWSPIAIGQRWRHNYDRVVNVITTPETTSVDIMDSSGVVTIFRQDAAGGDWEPVDQDITTTFEDIMDGSTHVGYLYITDNDTREYYDLDGLLYRIEYLGGEAIDLEYDVSDRLDTVTNEKGKTIEFNYNGSNQISSVVTPTGTFSYTYDADDNLSTVTKPDSEVITYHYEDTNFDHALTGVTDENGIRFSTYTYNTDGLVTSSKHYGDVGEYTFEYNSDETTTVTNPLGKETTYTFETIHGVRKIVDVEGHASTNCPAAGKSYEYDARGFMESKTDWLGHVTEFEHDDLGNVTSVTEAVGDTAERTTTMTYITDTRDPDVITQTGRTIDYDYDSDGRVTDVTVTDTNTSESRTVSYSYYSNSTDANGNTVLGKLYQVDGPRTDVTDVTTYTYDANFRLETVTNALGHEIEITSYDSANRPLTFEDADDVETTLVYDSLGRMTSSTRASGTALAATTTYGYDDNGYLTSVEAPNGVGMTYSYDNAHRLTGVEDDMGNTITYTLDDAGNVTQVDYEDSTPTLKYTHSYVLDELSRIIESVDANTDSTEFAYDVNSNLTSITDANTNETEYAFDGLDRLIEVTDALDGVTSLDFNALDQLEGVEDPRSNETTYSYNAFGDITQEVSPDRGTISYTHDKAGNVTSMTDARSVVTNYTYDALNRLTDIEYPSDSSLDVEITYDSISGCGTSTGQLCSVDDASGTTDYVYDDLGRLTEVTETRGALSFTTEYDYDLAGVLTEITLPSGRVIDYTLNANGQVSAVAADINSVSTSLASSVSYLPFGPMASMTYGNSVTLSNTHNTAYQLTNRTIGSLMNENFTYDDVGNITAKGSDTYDYDDLYRLTEENTDTYTYDEIGNRLTKNTDDYTYPGTSSKLSDVEGDGVSYDAGGNITDDTAREYVIDAANRLESIEISSSTVGEYVYNASNQRTSKTVGGVTTHYVYGMGGLLYGEYDSSGNMIREYVYLNGEPLAQIDDVSSSDVVTYLHTDHLGTPRYGTNSAGTQVWAWDSDAFGIGTPTGSVTVNLRFPGQYFDAESDLHYNWNRYYNPETGRYVASDPIGLGGGLNTYLYASASPAMYIDPDGQKFLNLACKVFKVCDDFVQKPLKKFFKNCIKKGIESYKNSKKIAGRSVKDLKEAGKAPDKNGHTRAGRAAQKHGDRASDPKYPQVKGSATKRNEVGQQWLEEILDSDDISLRPNSYGGFDIFDKKTGRGARFDGNGGFLGFL